MLTVPSVEVAKSYLLAELSRIFPEEQTQLGLKEGLDRLTPKDLWRLFEALSFTYRLNHVFRYVSDTSFDWEESTVRLEDLTLTGMSPAIDAVTHSEVVGNSPLKFRDYLRTYFKEHPCDDPEGLGQFRPQGKPVRYPKIYLIEEEGERRLIDGSNRLMALLLQGEETASAFIGKKMRAGSPRIGDSTFWLLRHVYEQGDPKLKNAVLEVVKFLRDHSIDGKEAIQNYWIEHVRNPKMKEVGKTLLSETTSDALNL